MNVDHLAMSLGSWGDYGYRMPRGAWEVDGHAAPLLTHEGHRIGKIIPGHGLLLPADLKSLGITKKIPRVIERTPFMRLMEKLGNDRGAITSLASLRSATGRQTYVKQDLFNTSANTFISSSQLDGQNSVQGFNTTQNQALNRLSTVDAYNIQLRDPPAGKKTYLIGVSALCTTASASKIPMMSYVDVLSTVYRIPTDVTTQTITTPSALTRYTSGVGVYAMVVPYVSSTVFATASTLTIGYTNQAGGASTTTANMQTGQTRYMSVNYDGALATVFPFIILANGDYGIRTLDSFQLSVVDSSVSNKFGALLYRPLFHMQMGETLVTVDRDMRAEPEALVDFAVDGGGVLGFHTMIWTVSNGIVADSNMTFTFDTCEA